MQKEKITSDEISVVVQGPVHKIRTKQCTDSIRKLLPQAEIILSTWDGTDVSGLDYDILIMSKDPGGVLQKNFKSKKMYGNLNRMITSTNSGIEKASRKYILKLRSDMIIDSTNFLNMFFEFPNRCEKYKLFEKRILASTLFSKFAEVKHGKRQVIAFHVSDWWFFGLREDIKKYLLASQLVEEPYFSNYFEYPENKDKKSVYSKFSWRFSPEQYLGYSCFSKYFSDIKMEDCSDVSDSINEKSQICLANNFIFLEYKQSGIRNLKMACSKYEPFSGEQYLDLYNFYNFEMQYKKYCENSYIPQTHNIFYTDKKVGFKILRFYKHLYKLFDEQVSKKEKFEQFFIGIPFSALSLVPVIFRILKHK